MTIFQIAALGHLIIYFGFLIAFRGYLLYKRTGINPFKSKKKTGIEGFIEKLFAVCIVIIIVVAINFIFIEDNYKLLIPINYLETPFIAYLGIFFSLTGLSLGFIAQLQMGDSWRLGFNENETTKLISYGMYRYSRNPIYLGYFISNIGFFMLMPNALSLCLLALSYVAIEIKIRLEEDYLLKKNTIEYKNYLTQVRRWI